VLTEQLDRELLLWLRTHGHSPKTEQIVKGFSATGQHAGIWVLFGALKTIFNSNSKSRSAWFKATVGVVIAYLLNVAIKLVVRRPRPQLDGIPPLIDTPTQLSFPSAHATASFAAATLFNSVKKLPGLYHLAALMAISRVYLGVHYPSDVVAGSALGCLLGHALKEDK